MVVALRRVGKVVDLAYRHRGAGHWERQLRQFGGRKCQAVIGPLHGGAWHGIVHLHILLQVNARGAQIAGLQHRVRGNGPLDVEAPLRRIRRALVRIDGGRLNRLAADDGRGKYVQVRILRHVSVESQGLVVGSRQRLSQLEQRIGVLRAVVDSASGADHRLRAQCPGQADPRAEVLPVGIGAPGRVTVLAAHEKRRAVNPL